MKRRGERLLVAFLCAIFLFAASTVSAQEGPSAATAAPPPDGLIHTVVKGDTLWDLSARYLGSPWLWPQLWERNRFLTNPHYIYPGIRIVVFPPPSRTYAWEVQQTGSAPSPATAPAAAAASEAGGGGGAPAAAGQGPVLGITPEEFVRAGEFTPQRPVGIGSIRGGEQAKVAFSEGDRVYLSLDKAIPAGQLLGVYRVRGPVRSPAGRPVSGYVRYLVGILQVTDSGDGEVTAVVRKSFEDLGRDDLISEEIPSYSPVHPKEGGSPLEAFVVTGQPQKVELATGDVVYLDRGADAGVGVGDVFRLYVQRDDATWEGRERSGKESIVVAQAVVLRTLPGSATAYVTEATQSFAAGTAARRGAR